jgi:hypothetical protein
LERFYQLVREFRRIPKTYSFNAVASYVFQNILKAQKLLLLHGVPDVPVILVSFIWFLQQRCASSRFLRLLPLHRLFDAAELRLPHSSSRNQIS